MVNMKYIFTKYSRAEALRMAQTGGFSRCDVAADVGIGLSTLCNCIDG